MTMLVTIALGVAFGIVLGRIIAESIQTLAIDALYRYHDWRIARIKRSVARQMEQGR